MPLLRLIALATVLFAAACSSSARNEDAPRKPAVDAAPASAGAGAERPYLLEQVDDAAVVQLYADGFASLPLREKTLIWHLYQATLAGRDIFIDQKHRNALEMRALIEAVVTQRSEEHTSELQSQSNLVCRLLLEKKKKIQ